MEGVILATEILGGRREVERRLRWKVLISERVRRWLIRDGRELCQGVDKSVSATEGASSERQRRGEGKVELTFDSSFLPQNNFSSPSTDLTSTVVYKRGAVASKTSIETAPRAARVEVSDCSKTRNMSSRGKERRKGTI